MINKYSSTVNKFINRYGDNVIFKLTVIRQPISQVFNMIIKSFNIIPYDKYFHLSLVINDMYILEKNEIINLQFIKRLVINHDIKKDDRNQIQQYIINDIPLNTTIKQLLYNTQQYMKSKYFSYSGLNNNCQDFIISILKSNNINDDNAIIFIKQDVQYIKRNWPTLKNIMDFTTNSAALISNTIN